MKRNRIKKLISFAAVMILILTASVVFAFAGSADDQPKAGDYFVSLKMDGSICVNIYVNYADFEKAAGRDKSPMISLSYPDETRKDGKARTDNYTSEAAVAAELYASAPALDTTDSVGIVDDVYSAAALRSSLVSLDEARSLDERGLAGYSKLSCNIAPAQINEPVTMKAYVEGETEPFYVETFSVKQIAIKYVDEYSELNTVEQNSDKKAEYQKIIDLCRSIITYGDDAYRYFKTQSGYGFAADSITAASGYYNEPLITKASLETPDLIVEDYDSEFTSVGAVLSESGISNQLISAKTGYEINSFNFTCLSNTTMRYNVIVPKEDLESDAAFSLELKFTRDDADLSGLANNKMEKTVDLSDFNEQSSMCAIRIKGIPAQCLGEEYTVSLIRKVGEDSETVIQFKSSAMTYASKVFNGGYESDISIDTIDNTAEKLRLEKIMMLSAYRYYKASLECFGQYGGNK